MTVRMLPVARLGEAVQRGDYDRRLITVGGTSGPRYTTVDHDITSADPALRSPRGPTSVKAFCLPPREMVGRFAGNPPDDELDARPWLIVGPRACELRALAYLDTVFGSPPVPDPLYQAHRARLTIVSVDCIAPAEHCFCNLVEGEPWAGPGFDVNLSPLADGYLVEEASGNGAGWVAQIADLLEPATSEHLAQRDEMRRAAREKLQAQNAELRPSRDPATALAGHEGDERWQRAAADCVECGACTQICPTCHCFYLLDRQRDGQPFERLRAWDSCMWSGYSRMAGATRQKPNPRAQLRTRFANRYLHKFAWSPQQWGRLGCVGCGRCSEACPGRIDMRHVLQEAVV